jgi:hypothetical protein
MPAINRFGRRYEATNLAQALGARDHEQKS